MWSWANESSLEPRKFQTLKVKEFGEKKKYENLTNEHFDGNNFTGWELTSIAFEIISPGRLFGKSFVFKFPTSREDGCYSLIQMNNSQSRSN